MKKLFLPALVATAALIAASCQQEAEVETASISGEAEFTATSASQDTRTTLDGDVVKWSAGDEISINGVTYTGVPDKFNPTWATFSKKSKADASPRSSFKAYYPASLYQAATPVAGAMTILPEEQKYGDFSINPMYAESKNHVLVFKNVCGVLAIKLEKSDLAKIKSIRVSSSNHGMCGEFTVEPTETGFKAVLTDEQALTPVVLSCGEAVELSEDTTVFHIAIPEQRYKSLNIEISADGLNYGKSMTFTKTANVKANHIYPIDFKAEEAPVYIEGLYSGKGIKVAGIWWAPVNCGYDATDYPYGKLYQWGRKVGGGYDSTEGMQTATEATFDTDGYNKNPDDNTFYSWSSSPYDWYADADSKQLSAWPMKSTDTGYVDGKIANPCPTGWRVPTYDELNALTGNNGSTSIGGRGWDSSSKGYWFNGTTSPESGNGLFLPAAGDRSYSEGSASGRGSRGRYWSSSVNGYRGRNLTFYSNTASMGSSGRASGYSVRCVHE